MKTLTQCINCQAPLTSDDLTPGYDGFKSFYECPSCQWWSQLEIGDKTVGNYLLPVVKLFPYAPHDLAVNDLVQAIQKLPRETTPSELANFVQEVACKFLKDFCKAADVNDELRQKYEIVSGLVPTTPKKEFTLPSHETN